MSSRKLKPADLVDIQMFLGRVVPRGTVEADRLHELIVLLALMVDSPQRPV